MSGRNVWGFWDCNYCDNKHIRGDNDSCPSCGHRRDANVKFYIDTNNIVEVSADQKNDKANWICSFCGNQNSDKDQRCASCGASKNNASGDYFNHDSAPTSFSSAPHFESPSSRSERFPTMLSTRVLQRAPFRKIAKIAIPLFIVIAVIIGIVSFVNWFNTPVQKELTIDNVAWERSIDIEELRTYNESGWSLPHDARLSYTRTEIRTYKQVIDHYETKTRRTST